MTDCKINILVADDDEGDRKNAKRALLKSGLSTSIKEVSNLDDAIHECSSQSYDCILLDNNMPGDNGLEGIARLRSEHPYLAIILITGLGDEYIASEAIKRGASDYLPKSMVEPETIRLIIEGSIENIRLKLKVDQQKRELEVFARVMVHDLKDPILSVTSLAGMIKDSIERGSLDKASSYTDRILTASDHLKSLIDDVYLYTKSSEEQPMEKVNTQEALNKALLNLSEKISQSEAKITSDPLPEATCFEPQLVQLFQNLLSNSLKYCENTQPKIHIGAEKNENEWKFSVKDNGIGISEENSKKVFEPFFRAHTKRAYQGTGLGLSTCQKIVERFGGKIWCEPNSDEGTSFFFTIPVS